MILRRQCRGFLTFSFNKIILFYSAHIFSFFTVLASVGLRFCGLDCSSSHCLVFSINNHGHFVQTLLIFIVLSTGKMPQTEYSEKYNDDIYEYSSNSFPI